MTLADFERDSFQVQAGGQPVVCTMNSAIEAPQM